MGFLRAASTAITTDSGTGYVHSDALCPAAFALGNGAAIKPTNNEVASAPTATFALPILCDFSRGPVNALITFLLHSQMNEILVL